jgi:hypothetical protein
MKLYKQRIVTISLATGLCLVAISATADTYRWKDKDGKVHYGSAVPAEYADQPYDVLNDAGMLIKRVEDTTAPIEVQAEEAVKERAPLISDEERRKQSDRLLVIQYKSVEDINKARELELAQVGYDSKLIHQSFDSTKASIKSQVQKAANQQRSGKTVTAEQKKELRKLYKRLERDEERLAALGRREERIKTRFESDLERYQLLTAGPEESVDEDSQTQTDQG